MKLFKTKQDKRREELLKQHEDGIILQVDNGVDNKAFIQKPVVKGELVDRSEEVRR